MISPTQKKVENTSGKLIEKVEEKRNLDMAKHGGTRGLIGRNLFDGKQQKNLKRK